MNTRKNRSRLSRRRQRGARATAISLLALATAVLPALAQEVARSDLAAPIFDLAAENLKRVAASPSAVQEVLRDEPGLMLKLKHWIANDATTHGQVVVASELTDAAILRRLEGDTEFRALPTRLLQRYGFLILRVNPEAPQINSPELRLGATTPPVPDCTQMPRSDCAPKRDRPPSVPRAAPPVESISSNYGIPAAPRNEPQAPQQYTTSESRSDSLLVKRSSLDWELTSLPAALSVGDSENPELSIAPDPATPLPDALSAPKKGTAPGTFESSRSLVQRENPYPYIPSLYDMYLQVSARPARLERFGERVFTDGARDSNLLPVDLPVGPDYVVGPGDSLTINFWGGISQRVSRTVDREGRIALPEVGPVFVSGRNLSEVQRILQQTLRSQFRNISVDISLSHLRTIRIYVVGDIHHPGAYDISSLSTPLNALFAAGGPTAGGSLRVARHFRGNQLVQEVDLYDLLLRGVGGNLARLENGDTVLVPPLGSQITIEGAVRRPALYELQNEKNLGDVLALSGGILPTGALERIEVQRVVAHEKRTMVSLNVSSGDLAAVEDQLAFFRIQDRDEIHIFPIAPYNTGAVYLDGHVLRPGRYSFHEGMKLTDLISFYNDLLPEPAKRYAEIIRLNPPDYRPRVESFDLASALADPTAAPVLHALDTVRVFSRYDFENPPIVTVGGEVRHPGTYRTSGEIHLRGAIRLAGGLTRQADVENAQVFRSQPDGTKKVTQVNLQEAMSGNPLHNLLLGPLDFVLIHRHLTQVDPPTVYIKGEVAKPGRYLLTGDMRVSDLIRLGGGLKRSADPQTADLTRYLADDPAAGLGAHYDIDINTALAGHASDNLPLHDGDTLAIRQISGWSDRGAYVTVRGEAAHTGSYGIRPGERLSSVLMRAGGLLPTAYPQGTVFEREEVRRLQQKNKEQLIERIRAEAVTFRAAITDDPQQQAALTQAALQQRDREIAALQEAPVTGRLVVHLRTDLEKFAGSPDDIQLRNRDTIFIPKRPDFVIVTGQVYNSNALTYQPRRNVGWYLRQAGGPTDQADRKAVFIVRASGAVISGRDGGWWSGGVLSTVAEPGDTIIVPEKSIGGSTIWKNLIAIAQLAQASATTAFIATR